MLILALLGMYFDAAVVFFTISLLFFRMAMAVLCLDSSFALNLIFYSYVEPSQFFYLARCNCRTCQNFRRLTESDMYMVNKGWS